MTDKTVCFVSSRLGVADGASIAAAGWMAAFERPGFRVCSVAGDGTADRILPGLALRAPSPPALVEVDAALDAADIVVVENLCSLPLKIEAARLLAKCLQRSPNEGQLF
jgi:hypothetical protein